MALKDNIVGYWDMIGNSRDSIGTNHGTDNTVTYNDTFGTDTNIANYTGSTPSRTTTAAVFASGANAKSFSVWINSDSASDRGWIIAGGTDLDTQAFGLFIQSDALFFHGNGGASDVAFTGTVTQDAWTHVVVTYDGTTLRTYVNNVANASAARTLATAAAQAIWFGGRKNGDADGWFDGGISRIGVWNRALTVDEVAELYNNGAGLKYTQISGMNFKKATVNAADVPGTLSNFPAYVDLSRLGITTLAQANSVRVWADENRVTEYPREIVSATEMHVKITSLTSTSQIFIDWDGVRADYAVTDTYGRNNVWSDYRAVYHFEHTSGNATDSTANGFTLTNTTSKSYVTGGIGKGIDFGTAVRNTTELTTASEILTSANGAMSYSVRFKQNVAVDATVNNPGLFQLPYKNATGSSTSIIPEWNAGSVRISILRRTNVDVRANTSFANGTSAYYHVASVFDGSNLRGYLDATEFSTSNVASSGSFNAAAYPISLGGSYTSNNAQSIIDESRVRLSALSANWLTSEYNNQADEPGFWGTWSDVGGGVTNFLPASVPSASFSKRYQTFAY